MPFKVSVPTRLRLQRTTRTPDQPSSGLSDRIPAPARQPAFATSWIHWAVFALLLYVGFEALAAMSLRVVAHLWEHEYRIVDAQHLTTAQKDAVSRMLANQLEYLQHDMDLGWSIRHHGHSPDGLYRANAQGFRADVDVPQTPPRRGLRIAAFGDSFTHGDEVPLADTWEEQLVRNLRGVEVLNFGVPGYGVDQAFLRYQRDGVPLQPDVIFIGVMPENTYRHLSVFRPFYYPDTGIPLAKPRFLLEHGQLVLLPNPLPRVEDYRALLAGDAKLWRKIGQHDAFAAWRPVAGPLDRVPSVRLAKYLGAEARRRWIEHEVIQGVQYNADGQAFKLTEALLGRFAETVRRHGAMPIVLMFPERQDVRLFQETGRTQYPALAERLRANGIEVVDLIEGFRDATPALEEFGIAHYSARGNALVARQLHDYLVKHTIPAVIELQFMGTPAERPS